MEANNLVCRAHTAGRLGVDGNSMGHRAGSQASEGDSQIDEEVGEDRDSISLDNKPWSVYVELSPSGRDYWIGLNSPE